MGSGPSSVIMDSPPQDNPSPCRLTLTRREEGWAVKQPTNSPPPNLPDNVPPLKLCRRNRRWAIDGWASIKRPAPDVPHRRQRGRYMLRRTPKRRKMCKMRVANFRVCVCWLAVCHAAQMPFMLTNNVPHLLSEGLLITRASDIHVRRGTYTVLVVIDAPRSEPRMEERLNELRLVIEKLGTHQNYSRTTRNVWEQRIHDMEATMTPPSQMLPNTRIKRGLFNFVGEIGATLFGTATENQVAQLKHHITKAQRTNRRIVHATNELISVVNQTRAEVSLNRQHPTPRCC